MNDQDRANAFIEAKKVLNIFDPDYGLNDSQNEIPKRLKKIHNFFPLSAFIFHLGHHTAFQERLFCILRKTFYSVNPDTSIACVRYS